MHLRDKHIFITGGAKRLGRALADRLLDEGAKVCITYRSSAQEAHALVDSAKKHGRHAHCVPADLTDCTAIQTAVADARRVLGSISVLINCASDFYPTPHVTEAQWDSLLDTNLKGQFFFAQACEEDLKSNNGVMINFADVNGEHPLRRFTPYVISKAGVLMMTRNLALEWAPHVRVNSISPGPVLLPENFTEDQTQRAVETTLLKRIGTPKDIVEGVLFLLRNDYMTGVNLCVDGGSSLVQVHSS